MYRVEFYCPRQADFWQQDPSNPFWILGNAVKRCNSLVWQYHRARVVNSTGQVLYEV